MNRIKEILRNSLASLPLVLLFLTGLLMFAAPLDNDRDGMTQVEKRIGQALGRIEGVGDVTVVIRTVRPDQQSKGFSISAPTEEIPCGAVVVVQGGGNPVTRMKLTNALCALLGLSASQVEVIDMSEGG